jgi:uncharacterized oligopeptide transporter (OPT) family protein
VAALLATLTKMVFEASMPWDRMGIGAAVIGLLILLNYLLKIRQRRLIPILGFAIGMYLPMTTSFPLFLGGLFSYVSKKQRDASHRGAVLASGLVAGAAIMEVLLAIPAALAARPDILSLAGPGFEPYAVGLAVLMVVGLGRLFYR